jgi:uracil-DNA glycosylase family protein
VKRLSKRKAELSRKRAEHPLAPRGTTLEVLRREARDCKACDLWRNATQTVFGEGSAHAAIVLVGEQPGDQEDRLGHPFVGPAGRLLNEALAEAGIDRSRVYVTNAVKHFKWTPAERGKRRIHKKPRASEIDACRPWLEEELRTIRPQVLVGLGATAARALFGANFSITRQRGQSIPSPLAEFAMATVHPASILRATEEESRHEQMRMFIADLKQAARILMERLAA